MNISSIIAEANQIVFTMDAPDGEEIAVRERAATIGAKAGRLTHETVCHTQNGRAAIDRYNGKHDRLYSMFQLFANSERLCGVSYVTDFGADVAVNNEPYPQPSTKKALHANLEDIRALGIGQETYNINLPAIMTLKPDGAIPYEHDGYTYYFISERIAEIDRHMVAVSAENVLPTMILLNSPRLFDATGEKELLDAVIHPAYDWNYKMAFISAFDMRTEEGQRFYRAFCEFLAERYTRPDRAYGRVSGAIISNEVNCPYIWGNAGEMPADAYAREYAQALRLAWLTGKKHAASFRVYASFTHHWTGYHDATEPLRFYQGRALLDAINEWTKKDGDFDWHIAFHPYPEDLNGPDFWHDRTADFTFSTSRITFKNMEVLEAYMEREPLLYRRMPRRIIFSEQGFNTVVGPLREWTERAGEAGYALAYMKARKMKTVDMFFHHTYTDNPHEFGLNLGIRRYDQDAEGHVGEAKPIYCTVRDMDTPREDECVRKARAFIGDTLFDYLLNPPAVTGDRDTSKDEEFGNTT